MKKVVESKTGKFYLKKGVVLGKYIVISDTAGTLTMIDTTNDKVTDTKDIGEAFSGNITYDEMTGTIYFVAGTNDLYGIKVSADGKLKKQGKILCVYISQLMMNQVEFMQLKIQKMQHQQHWKQFMNQLGT